MGGIQGQLQGQTRSHLMKLIIGHFFIKRETNKRALLYSNLQYVHAYICNIGSAVGIAAISGTQRDDNNGVMLFSQFCIATTLTDVAVAVLYGFR